MFLDSDDWMDSNAIETAVVLIKKYDAQIVSWNYYFNYEDDISRNVPCEPMPENTLIYEKAEINERLVYDMVTPEYDKRFNGTELGAVRGVWGKIYTSDIIRNYEIRFEDELKIGEDACFNLDVLKYVNRVVFVNQYLNHYRIHSESENHKNREDIVAVRLELLENYRKRFEKNDNVFSLCYTREVLSCIVNCLTKYLCVHSKGLLKKRHELRQILDDENVEYICHTSYDYCFFTSLEKILIVMIRRKYCMGLLAAGKAMRYMRK